MEYLGAWGTLIYEKKLRSKISCQTPFKSDEAFEEANQQIPGSNILIKISARLDREICKLIIWQSSLKIPSGHAGLLALTAVHERRANQTVAPNNEDAFLQYFC